MILSLESTYMHYHHLHYYMGKNPPSTKEKKKKSSKPNKIKDYKMKANTNRTGQLFHQQHSVVHTMNYSMSKKNQ